MPPGMPMDPSMMGAPPGMPPGMPMDPSMMGAPPPPGMPMDLSMMGLDPSMLGALPPELMGEAPPEEGGQTVAVDLEDLRRIVVEAVDEAINPKSKSEGAESKKDSKTQDVEAKLDDLSRKFDELLDFVAMTTGGPMLNQGGAGPMPPPGELAGMEGGLGSIFGGGQAPPQLTPDPGSSPATQKLLNMVQSFQQEQ